MLALAVRFFQAGERVGVQRLAADLGVNRVTLYRWVGTREELLTEVIWRLSERTLDRALQELAQEGFGRSHAAEALHRLATASTRHPGVRRMWAEEEALYTRLMTQERGVFQARLTAKTRAMIEHDLTAGRVRLPDSGDADQALDDFALAAVRITETFVHTRSITGAGPESARTGRVLHALLRA